MPFIVRIDLQLNYDYKAS